MEDDRPYVVKSPTRIRLGPVAQQFARDYGISLVEMAKHLLHQHYNGDANVSSGQQEDFLPPPDVGF